MPLLIRLPAGHPARRQDLSSLVDLVPTILAFPGVTVPPGPAGRDLLDPASPAHELVRGESSSAGARFVRTERWKLVCQRSHPGWESRKTKVFGEQAELFETGWQLFSCDDDPAELHNLFADPSRLPEQLRDIARTIWSEDSSTALEPDRKGPSEDLLQQLEALGYLHLR